MLPNHLLDVVDIEDIGGVKKSVETTIDYEKLLMRLRDIKMLSNTQRKSPDILEVGNSSTAMSIVGSTSVDESANMTLHLAEDAIELDDISAALLHFSINDCSKTITLYNSIKDLKISKGLSDAALVGVMRAHLSGGSLKEVDRIFDSMIKDNNSPSVEMWELKIRSTARAKQPDAALAMVDRLVKAGIDTNCAMYD